MIDNSLTRRLENPKQHWLPASWRSGYAADCKSVYTGSIPVLASKHTFALIFLICKAIGHYDRHYVGHYRHEPPSIFGHG